MTLIKETNSILSLNKVTLGYPGDIVLSDVSFQVRPGEFIGVTGPNGSGKSTLLKGILGVLPVVLGEIKIFNTPHQEIGKIRKKIGYVAQKSKNEMNFPALVKEVVMMGLYSQIGWFRLPQKVHWDMVYQSLEQVGMQDLANRPIGDLSGGQHQRVMIARALAAGSELLLLDEPTSAVDISAQQAILEILERLNGNKNITVIMVSHDINEIVHFCSKVLLLNGQVIGFGTPKEVLSKDNLKKVYGQHFLVYQHHDHPHIMVGDFND